MKYLIINIINKINSFSEISLKNKMYVSANLTSVNNVLNVKYNNYWLFNQSKY